MMIMPLANDDGGWYSETAKVKIEELFCLSIWVRYSSTMDIMGFRIESATSQAGLMAWQSMQANRILSLHRKKRQALASALSTNMSLND